MRLSNVHSVAANNTSHTKATTALVLTAPVFTSAFHMTQALYLELASRLKSN